MESGHLERCRDTAHTVWAPQVLKKGWKRSWDVDGEGRSREKWPRRVQDLDVVITVDVLAETGRGSAEGTVGSPMPLELE